MLSIKSREKQVHTGQENKSLKAFLLFCKEKHWTCWFPDMFLSFSDKFYKYRGQSGNKLVVGTLMANTVNNGNND